ncbi:UvrD-helicase domain-containing protein [Thermococcus aciditolerans]|uniref:DNA 3'-5' helicase n=1 Tax=Thermococcus aciditolerans TaxID=2598455 RepID=A0A5C0SKD8_9EURY|nr:ATP-dependent helicase [Thermococcus aciditolerans]QEK14965.1 ATP-dependent helicase [Thermococcus aciditolerans]
MIRKVTIIGPPGTGKTTHLISIFRVLTGTNVHEEDTERAEKILGPLENLAGAYSTDEVLFITFSTSAEGELIQRITGKSPKNRKRTGISNQVRTLHSVAMTLILSEGGRGTGYHNDREATIKFIHKYNGRPFAIFARERGIPYDPLGEEQTVGNSAETLYTFIVNTLSEADLIKIRDSRQGFTSELRKVIMKEALTLLARTNRETPEGEDVIKIIDEYLEWKALNGTADFSEVLLRAYIGGYTLAGTKLEATKVLILDEAQDFSPLQWKLIRHIIESGNIELVIVAGDPLQSIYSFQGANFFEFLHFIKDSKKHVLDNSYRLAENVKTIALRLVEPQLRLLEAYGIRYKFNAREERATIRIFPAYSSDSGAITKSLIPLIRARINEGKKVLILVRTNEIAYEVEMALYGEGLAVNSLKKRGSLFQRAKHVLEAVETIRANKPLTHNEAEAFLRYTIFRKAVKLAKGDQKRAREKLLGIARKVLTGHLDPEKITGEIIHLDGKFESLPLPHDFKDVAKNNASLTPLPPVLTVKYLKHLLKKLKAAPEELIDFEEIKRYEGKRVVEFIQKVFLSGKEFQDTGLLYVDTIHAAKGHEGDVVILIDLYSSSRLELIQSDVEQFLEEARVLFVGLTRVKHELIFVYTNTSAIRTLHPVTYSLIAAEAAA